MKVFHFSSAIEFRRWLEINHATVTELQVGFYKKNSDQGGLTYQEAVNEALCFGWIDGVIRKIDAGSYTRRFTPRKSGSIWSNVNVAHVARLTALGKMRPAGLRAFAARTAGKTGIYSFEQKIDPLPFRRPIGRNFKPTKKRGPSSPLRRRGISGKSSTMSRVQKGSPPVYAGSPASSPRQPNSHKSSGLILARLVDAPHFIHPLSP